MVLVDRLAMEHSDGSCQSFLVVATADDVLHGDHQENHDDDMIS